MRLKRSPRPRLELPPRPTPRRLDDKRRRGRVADSAHDGRLLVTLDSPADRADGEQIAEEVLRVHRDSYGTGADNVFVHQLEDLIVVVIDGLELTKAEETLIAGGFSGTVHRMRSEFQIEIGSTFTAIVERVTGRRVRSFLSNTDLEDLFSVEFFRLQPRVF